MRTLTTAAQAALAGSHVPIAILVEMDLTEPLNLNSSSLTLTLAGVSYLGTAGLGRIDVIKQADADLPTVAFEFSGVPSDMVSLALAEPVQGKAVRVKLAIFDPATGAVLDVALCFAGVLDVLTLQDGKDAAVVRATAETVALDLIRPAGVYLNNDDQQALYPGDLAMQYVNDQVEQKIVWPASSYWKK